MIFRLFSRWTGSNTRTETIDRLHAALVAGARRPMLYEAYAVPDIAEGRFELAVLHTFLLVRRLKSMAEPAPDIAQELIDRAFAHFELGLREIGIGDVSVPKRMKKLAGSFYGRVQAYEAPLASHDRPVLAAALLKNVYGGEAEAEQADRLAGEVFRLEAMLERLTLEDFVAGRIGWPPEPLPNKASGSRLEIR